MELKDMNVAELTGTILFSSMLDDDAEVALKELLRRFRELEERRDFWIEKATLLQTENNELQKQVEDMKVCGNCINYVCEEDGQWRCENGFCDDKPSDTCKNWKQ